MIQEKKSLHIAAKIKAVGIALVGAGIAGRGSTYFTPKLRYDVPRILYPVYTTLGHKGLAVSMLLLGAILLGWSYITWKRSQGKPLQWLLIPGLSGVLVITALFIFQQKDHSSALQDMIDNKAGPAKAVHAGSAPGTLDKDTIAFPASVSEAQKMVFKQMCRHIEATIKARDAGAAWSAYNKLNVYVVQELKPGGQDAAQLQFTREFSAMMDRYNQQIKALQ